jgi:hypothetical protein
MAAIVLTLAEQRSLARAALIDATCREVRFTGDGTCSSAVVAARAARRLRDTMPVRSAYFYRLIVEELRDLLASGMKSGEWCT